MSRFVTVVTARGCLSRSNVAGAERAWSCPPAYPSKLAAGETAARRHPGGRFS